MAIAYDTETACVGGCGRVGVGDTCADCEREAETRCIDCGCDAATMTSSGVTHYPERCPACAAEERAEREASACEVCGCGPEAGHATCRRYLAACDAADNDGECAREAC